MTSLVTNLRASLAKTQLRAPLVWLRHRTLDEQDALIACYPRSGSTWFCFMLFEALTGQEADFPAVDRDVPYVGKQLKSPALLPEGGRVVRSHEPHPGGHKKAIYLARDVRDVVVSEYFYERFKNRWCGSFDEFVHRFVSGAVNPFGSWAAHVNSWMDALSENRVELSVIKYEDLRRDAEGSLKRALGFLGVDMSPDRIVNAIRNNSIGKMREKEDGSFYSRPKNEDSGIRFVREGSIGGWRQHLTQEQLRLIEDAASDAMARLGYQPESHVSAG